MANVLIGIQARSTSKRMPGKCLEKIDQITMLEHVLYAAKGCASFINKNTPKSGTSVTVVLLIPEGDQIKDTLRNELILEGPEEDVLTRYYMASKKYYPDFIVRLTGDCPFLVPALITKHITVAIENNLDYVTNTIDGLRTYNDSWDIEVMSKRVLDWLNQTARTPEEREHVTPHLKQNIPEWAGVGVIMGHIDHGGLKYSVDTKDEFTFARDMKMKLNQKLYEARKAYSVFRY